MQNHHGSPLGEKSSMDRRFMTKSELCALRKRVATSSLVREQRVGAVAFSLSLARCTIRRRREKARGSRELSSLSLSRIGIAKCTHERANEEGEEGEGAICGNGNGGDGEDAASCERAHGPIQLHLGLFVRNRRL